MVTGISIFVDCMGSGMVIWMSSKAFSFVRRRCWQFLLRSFLAAVFITLDLGDWL